MFGLDEWGEQPYLILLVFQGVQWGGPLGGGGGSSIGSGGGHGGPQTVNIKQEIQIREVSSLTSSPDSSPSPGKILLVDS